MAKKKATKKVDVKARTGEQLDLIDVQPENAKVIIATARRYTEHGCACGCATCLNKRS